MGMSEWKGRRGERERSRVRRGIEWEGRVREVKKGGEWEERDGERREKVRGRGVKGRRVTGSE